MNSTQLSSSKPWEPTLQAFHLVKDLPRAILSIWLSWCGTRILAAAGDLAAGTSQPASQDVDTSWSPSASTEASTSSGTSYSLTETQEADDELQPASILTEEEIEEAEEMPYARHHWYLLAEPLLCTLLETARAGVDPTKLLMRVWEFGQHHETSDLDAEAFVEGMQDAGSMMILSATPEEPQPPQPPEGANY